MGVVVVECVVVSVCVCMRVRISIAINTHCYDRCYGHERFISHFENRPVSAASLARAGFHACNTYSSTQRPLFFKRTYLRCMHAIRLAPVECWCTPVRTHLKPAREIYLDPERICPANKRWLRALLRIQLTTMYRAAAVTTWSISVTLQMYETSWNPIIIDMLSRIHKSQTFMYIHC